MIPPRSRWIVLGALLMVALSLAAIVLKNYTAYHQKPGNGEQAEAGYASAKKIIAGLDHFQKENGKYPQNLNELVPRFLEKNPQKDENAEIKFTYFPDQEKNTYRLRFIYEAPAGTAECNYSPDDKNWNCGEKS